MIKLLTSLDMTVSSVLAYDDQVTEKPTILAVHHAIHVPTMESNLLCPMQVWMNDVKVDETPMFLTENPTDIMHAISGKDGDGIQVTIPLSMRGVTSYFPTRKLTEKEFNSCPRFALTYEAPIWDPHYEIFKQQEEVLLDNQGMLQEWEHDESRMPRRIISAFDPYLSTSYIQCLDYPTHDLSIVLEDGVNMISSISTKKGKPSVELYDLAKRWGIGLETTKKTLLCTTQRGLHTAPNPLLSQRYRTNDRMFRYKRLSTNIFSDTMLGIRSHCKNTCAQVYAHRNMWCKTYPMRRKGEAHHLLSLLFSHEGVPKTLIMGEFYRKARQADCQVKQMEPYSPWLNAAEATIMELKKGTGRKMIRTSSPKVLWDDCLELEAKIWSSTASNIFELEGEVPKTVMNGETSNITQLCEFGWYDWVYFCDNAVTYPDDKWVLGRWLEPSIGVGPVLCPKLL